MNKFTLILLIFSVNFVKAQSSWKKIDSENYKAKTELTFSKTNLNTFNLYSLDTESFKKEVNTNSIITIPVNDEFADFYIQETPVFTNELAPKYGSIKSYSLKGIDDKTASGKISIGTDGIHTIIFSGKHSTVYIDPYTKDYSTYITYKKENIQNNDEHSCLIDNDNVTSSKNAVANPSLKNANDGTLRTYRLALACTIEYSNFHLNNQGISDIDTDATKKAAILSAMNTTITRVNGIFERDVAATMNIVVNADGENELIFLDSDDFSNNDAFELIEESQEVCDNIIGSSNYDIGHTFSTGAGGLATLGGLCSSNFKAQGVTGSTFPMGDSFDIDFVAHEIGHQFGANHTFNNSCNQNRWNSTAVEPGSGSTIMAYAGICPTNVQNNSDDYFHSISIDQMWATMQSTSCATETSTNNASPVVNAGNDVSVPKSTPLILRGEATDIDSNGLTYCWEQTDNEIATMPPVSTNLAGPAFRSFAPTDSPNRYLPTLTTIVNGDLENEWEVLPSVAREMNFSLVVRDNHANGGASERDNITISVIDTDPFTVTSPNTAVSWDVGLTETITWDKSTTDVAPISCENVKITLSLDGGETFPITLVESTPNDGSYDVIVPNQLTSTARIMIEGIDNIFYNVNTTNFSIISSGPTFLLSNISDIQETCSDEISSVNYTLDVDYINDFSETVDFTLQDLPDGVTGILTPNSLDDSGEITITLNNFNNVSKGDYTIRVNGTSSSLTSTIELPTLIVNNAIFDTTTLSTPTNNSNDVITEKLSLTWSGSEDNNSLLYDLEIATDINFSDIFISKENIITNSFTISEILDWDTTYYWRVKSKNNCREGDFSSVYNFTTEDKEYCNSNFTSIDESEFITNVTFGSINNDSGDDSTSEVADGYEDFTNISTLLKLGEEYTLSVTLDPVGFQDHCYVFIDWNNDSRFDEDTERYDLGNHSGSEESTGTLEITVPNNATLGETRMRVIIEYYDNDLTFGTGACDADHNWEFGETEDYTLVITDNILEGTDDIFENFSIYPNPVQDHFILTFDIPFTDESILLHLFDTTGRLIMSRTYDSKSIFFTQNIDIRSLQTGIYSLNISNGSKYTNKKLIIR